MSDKTEFTVRLDNSSIIPLLTEIRDEIRGLRASMLSFVSSVHEIDETNEIESEIDMKKSKKEINEVSDVEKVDDEIEEVEEDDEDEIFDEKTLSKIRKYLEKKDKIKLDELRDELIEANKITKAEWKEKISAIKTILSSA